MSITTREDVARLVESIREARRDLHRWPIASPTSDAELRCRVDDLTRRMYAASTAALVLLDAHDDEATRQALYAITALLRPIPHDPR